MSTPTTYTAEDFGDTPERFSLLPLPNGDFVLVYHDRLGSGEYVILSVDRVGVLKGEFLDQLVHLAPVPTHVDNDIVEQFKRQLGIEGDA